MQRVLILGVNGFIGHHLSQRILRDTDWEVFGMDMQTDRITDLLPEPRFHFFEGDITINREWIEYHVKKCDVVLPLVAIATPATYVTRAAARVRARLRGQPADRPRLRALPQAAGVPVDLGGLRDVRATPSSTPRPRSWCWDRSTSRAGSTPAPSS